MIEFCLLILAASFLLFLRAWDRGVGRPAA